MEKRRTREVFRRYTHQINIAIRLYGRRWKKIEQHIGTRTSTQIRSHAQKCFLKSRHKKPPPKPTIQPNPQPNIESPQKIYDKASNKTSDTKTIMNTLREHINSVMTQVTAVRELKTPMEKTQLLDLLKERCLCINNDLRNVMPQIIFGIGECKE